MNGALPFLFRSALLFTRETTMTKNKIGYGNPPETTKFKKGICPNPKGRPRKTNLMLGDLVDRALQSKMHFTERGLPLSASRLRVTIKSHIARALSGDIGSALALLKMREQAITNEDYGDTIRIRVIGGMPPPRKAPKK